MIRRAACVLFLGLILAGATSIPGARGQAPVVNLRLYAHTDYYLGAPEGRLLSTAPPYGERQSSIVDRPFSFYLYPAAQKDLRIDGTISFRGWFRAAEECRAEITVSFFDLRMGVQNEVRRIVQSNIPLGTEITSAWFGIGDVSYTLRNGSILGVSILVRGCGLPLLYWDNKETATQTILPLVNPDFTALHVRTFDDQGAVIKGANVTVTRQSVRVWTGTTNSTGWASIYLLAIERPSLYNLTVFWFGAEVNRTRNLSLPTDVPLVLRCEAYDLKANINALGLFPVPDANLRLLNDRSQLISSGNASSDGTFLFRQIPKGKYTLEVSSEGNTQAFEIDVPGPSNRRFSLAQPPRYVWTWLLVGAAALVSGVGVFSRIQGRRLRSFRFNFFKKLVAGGIPPSSIVMVTGNSGSGKTILLEHFADEVLAEGRPCVFVTNVDFPHRIRDSMKELGMSTANKAVFIDCYSATAGMDSKEELVIRHPQDLTSLGVQLTSSLTKLGQRTDILLDSLGPMISGLRPENLVSFIHSIGARVRGNMGRFFFSVGSGAPKELINRLEEISDCIIEIDVSEHGGKLRRRMRVKKLKGQFVDRWVNFSVKPKAGLVFQASESILKSLTSSK